MYVVWPTGGKYCVHDGG